MTELKRIGVIILFVTLALGTSLTAFAAEQENQYLLFDPEDRALLITALKERGIPYRIDAEGGVRYPASEVRVVDEMLKGILQRCTPGNSYDNPADMASFVSRLKAESIPYKRCKHFGREYVTWEPRFNERVEAIIEILDDEVLTRLREEKARPNDGECMSSNNATEKRLSPAACATQRAR